MKFVWIIALALVNSAYAQSPLGTLISAGRKHALSNKAAHYMTIQRDAEKDENYFELFPRMSVSGGYTYNQWEFSTTILDENEEARSVIVSPHHQFDARIQVEIPLFDIQAIHRYRSAKQNASEARFQARVAAQQVDAEVARAYYQYVAALEMTSAVASQRELSSQILVEAQNRVKAGVAAPLEVERAKLAVNVAYESEVEVSGMLSAARRALMNLTGVDPETLQVMRLPESLHNEKPLENWLSEVGSLPAVKGAESSVLAAREDATAAKRWYLPRVSLNASDTLTNAYGLQGHPNTYRVGVVATWNFDLKKPATYRASNARVKQANVRVAQAREEAAEAIASTYEKIEFLRVRCFSLRDRARLEKEAAQMSLDRYAVGSASQAEVLSARQTAFAADVARIRAESELEYLRVLLRIVAGKDLRKN